MKILSSNNKLLALVSAALLLSACTTNPNRSRNLEQLQAFATAQSLEAEVANSPHLTIKALTATQAYIKANAQEHAANLLLQIDSSILPLEQLNWYRILQAQIKLKNNEPQQALTNINEIWVPESLETPLRINFYQTRADILAQNGKFFDAVQDRIALNEFLTDLKERQDNEDDILRTLNMLTPQNLTKLKNPHNSPTLNGWLDFTNLHKQYDLSPEQLRQQLISWYKIYPKHPAAELLPSSIMHDLTTATTSPTISDTFYNKINSYQNAPDKIALLLPLSGTYGPSAQAIRNGFLAGYYQQATTDKRPQILLYDTSNKNLAELYQQAVTEGAQLVVGPLLKAEVDKLNSYSRLPIPVLALNKADKGGKNNKLYQFGLVPELEAESVARKAWQDGKRQALVIYTDNPWGHRINESFSRAWQELGGQILTSQPITKTTMDKDIKSMLNVDQSQQRAQALRKLGLKFNYQSLRRNDIDMIFLASNSETARQVKPLLNYYYANNVATYATSSIYQGTTVAKRDQDLNGIIFCDMPWTLDESIVSRAAYQAVSSIWNNDFDKYTRLYALGLDSYKIALQLADMHKMDKVGIAGMTGVLKIDNQHNIHRDLMWAKFVQGKPKLIGSVG